MKNRPTISWSFPSPCVSTSFDKSKSRAFSIPPVARMKYPADMAKSFPDFPVALTDSIK